MRQYQRSKIPAKKERLKPPAADKFVHSFVRRIWLEMNHQQVSQEDVALRSGVSSSAMRKWRDGSRSPKLVELEAVVNTLGYKIVLKPSDQGKLS